MKLHKKNIDDVLDIIIGYFSGKKDIHSVFVSGSKKCNNFTVFSDLDICVVFQTEKDLNEFQNDIIQIMSSILDLKGYYFGTKTHYFFITTLGIQIDFNFITTAQYFSIKKSDNKDFIIDNKNSFMQNNYNIENLDRIFLEGYTTLERAISKYIKQDYIITIKFIDGIRANSIVPLFNYLYPEFNINNIDYNFEVLDIEMKKLFISTYTRLQKEDIYLALKSIYSILIFSDSKINHGINFDIEKQKINHFFTK